MAFQEDDLLCSKEKKIIKSKIKNLTQRQRELLKLSRCLKQLSENKNKNKNREDMFNKRNRRKNTTVPF